MQRTPVNLNQLRGRTPEPVEVEEGELSHSDIERQTEEFLRNGGGVEVIPTGLGARAIRNRELPIVDPITGRVASHLPREVVKGRMVLRVSAAAKALNVSKAQVRRMRQVYTSFPAPLPNVKPLSWDEETLLAWRESKDYRGKK